MSVVARQRQPDYLRLTGAGDATGAIAQTVSVVVEQDGQVAHPASAGAVLVAAGVNVAATYTLVAATGTAVTGLDGVAASVATDGTVSYAIAAALTTPTYSDDYTSRWAIVVGGVVYRVEREALLVRCVPVCPATVSDLKRRLSELYDEVYWLPTGRTDAQSYIDEAWDGALSRALQAGVHVHEVVSWYGWREYVLRAAELLIARDLMVARAGESKWLRLWEVLGGPDTDARSAEWSWARLTYRIDHNQDGVPDTIDSRPGVQREDPASPAWRGF